MVTKRIRRQLTGAQATIKPVFRSRLWLVPIVLILLAATAWWTRVEMTRYSKVRVAGGLGTILNAGVTALEIWLDDGKAYATALARTDHVRNPVATLEQLWSADPGAPSALLASPAQAELREFLEPLCGDHGYPGFAVVTPDGAIIAGEEDDGVGEQISSERIGVIAGVLAGETVVSHPFIAQAALPDANGVVRENLAIMVVAAPVRDAAGRVIAVLALRIDPDREFSRILQTAQMEQSGETYAFNAQGLLLSHSRFDEQLRSIGLIPDLPDSSSQLTLQIRDPGGNLLEGYSPGVERGAQPLTRMAASAVTGQAGIDVEGYRDYRGVRVVGAWAWLDEFGFGVASEMDYDEALAMPGHLRRVFWSVVGVLALVGGLILLGSRIISRMGRQMSDAMLEARKLGQYTLEEKIGEGGMGEVYRASHAMLRRPTAIKLLHAGRAEQQDIARFEREVQITSRLTHPNTIAIFDYGRTPEGVFYYAMEYLPGIDLARLIESDGPQPEGRVIYILRQVCGSLAEAHATGLIHRDIKPENIILCERGAQYDVAKVLDFGIVKDLGGGAATQLTAAGSFFGTPLYISPEAIKRPETVDARADIYALGAIGYFLLVGQPPFEGETLAEVCAHHLNTQADPPSRRSGRPVADDLEKLLLSCLAKDPGRRPQTAGELGEALTRCAAAGQWTQADARDWWAQRSAELGRGERSTEDGAAGGHTATIVADRSRSSKETVTDS